MYKLSTPGMKCPVVTFAHFLNFNKMGPKFRKVPPSLADRMYPNNIRHVMDDLTELEYGEVIRMIRLVALVRDLASAIQEAHGHGIVHRDLQPQRGEPVVVHFELARFHVSRDPMLTQAGSLSGTPGYMSPE